MNGRDALVATDPDLTVMVATVSLAANIAVDRMSYKPFPLSDDVNKTLALCRLENRNL